MSRRAIVLVLIVGLMALAVVIDQRDEAQDRRAALASGDVTGTSDLARLVPTATPDDALDSAWFCPAGGADPEGPLQSVLVMTNPTDRALQGEVTVVPDEGDPVVRPVEVAAGSRVDLALVDVVQAAWAATMVRFDGGGAVVERRLASPTGRDVAACTTEASTHWYVASGATTKDATETLVVYNPFPEPAVVDMRFPTEDGVRTPEALHGMPVAGRSVRVVDVTGQVTVRPQVAAEVVARSGRVVVDRVQTFDGSGASTTEEGGAEETFRPEGLSVSPAVPRPQTTWALPLGLKREGLRQSLVVLNPNDRVAEVEVSVTPDDPEFNPAVDPFGLQVPAGSASILDLQGAERLTADVGYSIVVRSINDAPVVVDRLLASAEPYGAIDTGVGTGSPVAAPRWVVGSVRTAKGVDTRVAVDNAGDSAVTVQLVALLAGQRTPLGEDVRLAPGEHRVLSVGASLTESQGEALLVEASGPVVVEWWLVESGEGFGTALAVPLAEGLVRIR